MAEIDKPLTVTLVATGGQEITLERDGIAPLIGYGGDHLLIDSGRNVMQNLCKAEIDPVKVENILLTHRHNDHY